MSTNTIEVIKSILGGFYKHSNYKEATIKFKKALTTREYYSLHWEGVKETILKRKLNRGEPLSLMNNSANLPLDENTDEEAYKWLDLMIKNIECKNEDDIVEY